MQFEPRHSDSTVLRLTQEPLLPPATTRPSTQNLDLTSPIKLWSVKDQDSFQSYEGTIVHVHGYSLIQHGRSLTAIEWLKLRSLHVFVFHVSGITDHQQAADSFTFAAGKVLFLERNPASSYDPNEIRVISQDGVHQAGFVPKDVAEIMAPIMDSTHTSRASGAVLKTFFVAEGHRKAIEVVAAAGRELRLVL
jgi:hypothetical protein